MPGFHAVAGESQASTPQSDGINNLLTGLWVRAHLYHRDLFVSLPGFCKEPFVMSMRVAHVFICLLVLILCGAAYGQQAPPYKDTPGLPEGEPQSERIRALLAAFNSGDRDKILAFFAENLSPELRERIPDDRHVEIAMEIHDSSGGMELYGLRHYDPPRPATNRTVIMRNTLLDTWQAFVLEFEEGLPHRITSISLAQARPPSDLPPAPPLSLEEALAEIKKYLERFEKADAHSGTTLIAKDGKVIFTHVCGEATKAWHIPNKLDTKFNLGSMNKMFTAVAIAQLVESGKLSFDDTVEEHLGSDWLPPEIAAKVTISQLLSHTSGLGSHFTDKFWESSRERFRALDDYKQLVVDQELRFQPGTEWAYSNAGFLVAGAIIEKVTGQSYFDYVREHIYDPAGMVNTDCYELDLDPPNLAIGYTRERMPDGQTRWVNNLFKHVIKGGPAGGGFSTVEDLLRFAEALRSEKLVSRAMLDVLWSPKPASPEYGYGFALSGSQGEGLGRVVGHGGGFPGISSNLEIFLDSGYIVAVLSNYDQGATIVSAKYMELLQRVK